MQRGNIGNTLGKCLNQVMAICSFSLLSCVPSPILRRPTRGEILPSNISKEVIISVIYNQVGLGVTFLCKIILFFYFSWPHVAAVAC